MCQKLCAGRSVCYPRLAAATASTAVLATKPRVTVLPLVGAKGDLDRCTSNTSCHSGTLDKRRQNNAEQGTVMYLQWEYSYHKVRHMSQNQKPWDNSLPLALPHRRKAVKMKVILQQNPVGTPRTKPDLCQAAGCVHGAWYAGALPFPCQPTGKEAASCQQILSACPLRCFTGCNLGLTPLSAPHTAHIDKTPRSLV